MCGTLKRSRTIVTPARGTLSATPGPSSSSPKRSDLNFVSRSAAVTWSKSGVSASYISAWASAPAGGGTEPVLAGRDDVARGGGVVVGGGGSRGKGERRRGERGDPGHPRHAIARGGYGAAHAARDWPPRRSRRCWPRARRCVAPLARTARAGRAPRRAAARPPADFTPDITAASDYAFVRPGSRRVRGAHRGPLLGPRRGLRVPVRERAEGDAARRLRAPRPRPPVHGRRAQAAGADDPLVGQRRGLGRSSPASAPTASTAWPAPRVCPTSRPQPRSGATRGSPPATRRASSSRSTPAPAPPPRLRPAAPAPDRREPALGHRRNSTCPSWRVYFKGGWGSGTGAVDHQVALLTRGDERIAVAVLTASNGSHAAGKETLEGVFRRLLHGL